MKWSLKIAEVSGIGIYVHWTFSILLGWIIFIHARQGQTVLQTAIGVGFVLALFACVVLHELGHALTAARYHIRTRDITLLPIGGLARLEKMPDVPLQELWVALAGPAVNVVIAALLGAVLWLTGTLAMPTEMTLIGGTHTWADFGVKLLLVNVILVAFNMLPAFPMDGGRVLRALLAQMTGDYTAATQAAASVGQMMAIFFGFMGLMSLNPFLLFIALFVFLGAAEEAHAAQLRSYFHGLPVRVAMMTRFRSLPPEATLAQAADELLAGSQQDFPVVEDGQVLGVLTRSDLVSAMAERGPEAPVREVMQTDCPTVNDGDMLQGTFERMQQNGCRLIPVLRDKRLVGVLSLENIGELVMLQSALRRGGQRPSAAITGESAPAAHPRPM